MSSYYIIPTQEELIKLHKRFLEDPVIKNFHIQLSKVYTYAIPVGIDVIGLVYDEKVTELIKKINSELNQYIISNYANLLSVET